MCVCCKLESAPSKIQIITCASGGPEESGFGSPERPLPRTPALYNRKTKWTLKDDGQALHGDWRTNYSSLSEHESQVVKQYDAEIADGMMTKMSLGEALDRFGTDLILAATGAIAKKGSEPGGGV